MPYIEPSERTPELDAAINKLCDSIRNSHVSMQNSKDFSSIAGKLNYSISRLCARLIEQPSYIKIAIITGVLENIKQEFYRRIASCYEDEKVNQNGDIEEFSKIFHK